MKKLFILFLFFFFIPIVNADYQVTDYKIDMTVLENGDIEVIEVFKMEGEYNGFERIIMYLTGVSNIRDVIPYPRTVGNAEF